MQKSVFSQTVPCGNPSCDGSCGTCEEYREQVVTEERRYPCGFTSASMLCSDGCGHEACPLHCGPKASPEYLAYLNDPTFVLDPRR